MSSAIPPQIRQLRPAAGQTSVAVRLLGSFSCEVEGKTLSIASKRARALIAYLAQRQGEDIARSTITDLLWGERGEDQARASLRQTLSELRGLFATAPVQPITATNETLSWKTDVAWIDTLVLRRAAVAAGADEWEAAAACMRGEFLEGLDIGEPGFEQWLTGERQRLRQQSSTILAALMTDAENAGNREAALSHGQRLLTLDPLQEHVHRSLMRIYTAQHRHDAALAQFERCKRELASQLKVSPAAETEVLARAIKAARRGEGAKPPDGPKPALPGNPSIAVLPFINLTNDPRQEFFADGMTEDIISALSRIRELFVISRSSSFVYKYQQVRADSAARELGVRYILEGSVRVAANRVRINVQLVDGLSGNTTWSERYEGELDDIFALQDEITRNIALAMEVTLTRGESARLWESQTKNLRAWEKAVVARDMLQRYTTRDVANARRLLEEAVLLDPAYTGARALLGITHYWDARFSISMDASPSLLLAESEVAKIFAIDPESSTAHVLNGAVAFMRDQHADAIRHGEAAVQRSPGDSRALAFLGMFLLFNGEPAKAYPILLSTMRTSPKLDSWYRYYLTLSHLWMGELAAARESADSYVYQEPIEPYGYMYLAAICEFQEHQDQAAAAISSLKTFAPVFGSRNIIRSERYREPEKLERVIAAVGRAGLA